MYQTVTLAWLHLVALLAVAAGLGALVGTLVSTALCDWIDRRAAKSSRIGSRPPHRNPTAPPRTLDGTASRWPADEIGRPLRRWEDRQGGES